MNSKRQTTTVDLELAAQGRAHRDYLGELLADAKHALLCGETEQALTLLKRARQAWIGSSFGSNDAIIQAAREYRQTEAFAEGYEVRNG